MCYIARLLAHAVPLLVLAFAVVAQQSVGERHGDLGSTLAPLRIVDRACLCCVYGKARGGVEGRDQKWRLENGRPDGRRRVPRSC